MIKELIPYIVFFVVLVLLVKKLTFKPRFDCIHHQDEDDLPRSYKSGGSCKYPFCSDLDEYKKVHWH